MTREEAKSYIGELQMYAKSRGWDEEYLIACDIAMNALEQEPILDKIRAEIQNGIHHFLDGEPIIEIKEVLQILDKYIAESEE